MNINNSSYLNSSIRYKLLSVFGFLCFGFVSIFLFWSSNKGFELSDESYYTIGYNFNIETDNSVSLFHSLYNRFFGWLNLSLVQNRVLANLLIVLSSFFLAKEAANLVRIKHKLNFYLLVIVTSGLYHAIFPMAVSYNIFSVVFINGLMASVLGYINRGSWSAALLIGFFSLLLIFNKFTNVVVLIFFVLGILALFHKKYKAKQWLLSLVFLLLGGALSVLFVFGSIENFTESYQGFKSGLALSTEHSISNMIAKFLDNSKSILSETVYLIPLVVLLVVLKFYKTKYQEKIVVIAVVITYIGLIYKFYFFLGNYQIVVFYYLTFVIVLSLLLFYRQFKKNRKELLLGILFMCIPFVSSLGTNNSLFLQFLFYGGVFGAGLFLWLNQLHSSFIKQLLIFGILLVATVQITYKKMNSPYRMEKLSLHTKEVKGIPFLDQLNVDSDMYDLIEDVKTLRSHPSKYIFLFSEQLGLSILTDKKPILYTWLNESSTHLIPQLLEAKADLLQDNILFVLPRAENKKQQVIEELTKAKQLNFLENYKIFKILNVKDEEFELYEKHNS